MGKSAILDIYDQSTPDERWAGNEWYGAARRWCRYYGELYGFSGESVAGALAALSPLCPWSKNAHNTVIVMEGVILGKAPEDVKVSAPIVVENRRRAMEILKTGNVNGILSGNKVTAFFDNIAHPESRRVTVDNWTYRVWKNEGFNTPYFSVYPALYRRIETDFIEIADSVGLRPYVLQATVWIVARRYASLRPAVQLSLPLCYRYY